MEYLFNTSNIKSLIVFFHLSGLALGLGGAWVLDAFMFKNKDEVLTEEKFQVIEFVSRLVIIGLGLLWASGLGFIVFYYCLTPEFLQNQKVWGKAFIVTILSINGFFIHTVVLPKIEQKIGKGLLVACTRKEIALFTAVGAISAVSWLFPIALGVTSSLNFTVSMFDIVGFYLGFLCSSVLIVSLLLVRFSQGSPQGSL